MNLLSITLVFIATSLGRDVNAADDSWIKVIADSLGKNLGKLVTSATKYSKLSEDPKTVDIEFHDHVMNGSVIKHDIASLKDLFNDRLSVAKATAEFAETTYANHTKKYNLDESYEYFDAKTGDESLLKNEEYFGKNFNLSFGKSAVQTPADVYQYTVDVLNSIDWTKKLDKKFKENADLNNIKAWQYIGLSNGVYRSYPRSLWRKASDELQYFDVRRRSWYIEGSSTPKDMVIILDLSGSVIGNRLLIIKLAIISLLNTLQENDFVNIVYFNKNAHYLKKCWKHLVQATERNKKILKNAILSDFLKGKDVAKVGQGFRLAFEILKESRKSGANSTSNCTQTIAFFTDGVEGDTVAEDVFHEYNREKKIRIFTYLVGREIGSPFTAVKWIACSNRGYFYRIETLSDVRENIVKYITVLSRLRNQKPKWTPLYLDAQGLGMVTGLVVPIFDNTTNKLLGVLGSDLLLDDILAKFPEPHLGSGGYPFAITNNGLVFFHPLLEQEDEVALKHPVNVYLSEVMHHFSKEDKTAEIAKAMIDKETKDLPKSFESFHVLAKYNGQFRVVKRKLAYSYEHIDNTSFSLGIATTDYGSKQIKVTKVENIADVRKYVDALSKNNLNVTIGKKWPYCPTTISDWEGLKKNLKDKTKLQECRKKPNDLINLVIYDIARLEKWNPDSPSSSKIKAVFVGTTSGLTFFNSLNDSLGFSTSIKQGYFERAADAWKDQTIIFSAASQNEVRASKAVVFYKGTNKEVLWGVAGVDLYASHLKKMLNDEHKKCAHEKDTYCYLVDENGYVVVSENEEEIGKFFGVVEGNVMRDLFNNSVYKMYNFTDVQATCEVDSDDSSSSVRLFDPLFSFVNYAKWWTQTIALSLVQYSFYAVMTGTNQVQAEESAKTKPCFKKMNLYFFDAAKDEAKAASGNLSYGGCQRSYESYQVKNTNLLLVVVNVNNSIYCKKTEKMNIATDYYYETSCDLVDQYRVAAEEFGKCFPDPKKPDGDCSSGKLLIPSIVFLILLQVLVLLCKE